jgi:exodeoxyribonuclease-3
VHLSVSTWNINSVRLRIQQVRRFLKKEAPDVLCLQETKCPDDRFPLKQLRSYGYPHITFAGQKGYNGVAILSRFPFATTVLRQERRPAYRRDAWTGGRRGGRDHDP